LNDLIIIAIYLIISFLNREKPEPIQSIAGIYTKTFIT